MSWLREVHPIFFYFGLFMVLLLSAVGVGAALWTRRLAGAARGRSPVAVNALTEGRHLVRGRADGPLLQSPLTGQRCVWWQVWVWERVVAGTSSDDRRIVWRERRHEDSGRVILCTRGLATCAVQTQGTSLIIPTELRDWKGRDYPPERRDAPAQPGSAFSRDLTNRDGGLIVLGELKGDRYRYLEEIIVPGSELYVLGRVTRVDPAQWADEDAPDDEGIDATVDDVDEADAGGEMDPDEQRWLELDRLMAQDMRQAQWQVGPEKGQPYVVAVQPPEQWEGAAAQASTGGWIMGAAFAALAAFMLWVRLGGA